MSALPDPAPERPDRERDPRGDRLGAHVFPSVVPETQTGASLAYSIISNEREHNLNGPNGIANARVHFVAQAPS